MNELKQRNGCVTGWLWILLGSNLCMALYYAVEMFGEVSSTYSLGYGLLSVLGVWAVLSGILLMRWLKVGFYMLVWCTLLATVVNIGLLDLPVESAFSLLTGVLVWWGILQLRKNRVSAWKQLQGGWDYLHCRHLYQFFAGIMLAFMLLTVVAVVQHDFENEGQRHIRMNVEEDEWLADDEADNQPTIGEADSLEWVSNDEDPALTDEDSAAADPAFASTDEDLLSLEDDLQAAAPRSSAVEEEIQWITYWDDKHFVSVEAPSDFMRMPKQRKEQLMLLGCTDADPSIVVVQEKKNIGLSISIEKYAYLVVKNIQKTMGKDFRKIDEGPQGRGRYRVTFRMKVDDYNFHYTMVAAQNKEYFYYCMVCCLEPMETKLKPQMDRIIRSFRIL